MEAGESKCRRDCAEASETVKRQARQFSGRRDRVEAGEAVGRRARPCGGG